MTAGRVPAALLAIPALALLVALALAASASAAIPFCPPGASAGQCNDPRGLASDWETGHVYVVDRGNGRINVFESDGTFLSSFGAAQLTTPTWVAVDNDPTSPSHHSVYVAADNFEVQKFKASGEFVKSFGGEGKGACQLTSTQDPIAVGPGGVVNVADSFDKDGAGSSRITVNRVQQFDSEGKCLGEVALFEGIDQQGGGETISHLAVDSLGNFYASVEGGGGVIRKYSPTGTFIADLGGAQTEGLVVDVADNLFAKQVGVNVAKSALRYFIAEYAPDTSLVKRFGYFESLGGGTSLAVLESGSGAEGVFSTERTFPSGATGVTFLKIPAGPVIVPEPCHLKPGGLGSVRATLQAEVNPEGKETTVHVEYSGGGETKSSPPEPLGGPADFELHEATVTLTGLKPETTYHCQFVAENADGTTPLGQDGSFETKEGFEFGPATVTKVGTETATLNAVGNPLGLPAIAEIEYVTDAQFQLTRFDEALTVPEALDYGAGETSLLRSATLTGLDPATTYHWRLRVKNGFPPEGIVCPRSGPEPCPVNEHVFRTYGPPGAPDDRGYELVSPGQKNSAEVATPIVASGVYEDRNMLIQVSSGSGEAATYTSFTSFGKDAEGAPSASQYLSKRSAGGWVTENISPFGFQSPILSIPFKGFTPELDFAAFKVSDGALAPGCPEGVENLFLRDSATGDLTCLTPEVPLKGSFPCLNYAGASEDGGRVFFASGASYAGAPQGYGFNLYEWSAGGGLKPISILPGQSQPVAPTQGTIFGPTIDPVHPNAIANCQFGQTIMRHVVSADGTKAFWTFVPEASISPPDPPGTQRLTVIGAGEGTFTLAFKEESQKTAPIPLDANAAAIEKALESVPTIGAGNVEVSGSGPFTIIFKGSLAGTSGQLFAYKQAATQLLARVNGTETVRLDAKPEGQKKESPGPGPFGNGVFQAANKDGSVVYFTAPGRLTSSSKAEKGKPDLYRYQFNRAEPLSDLTKSTVPGNVQGVVGASDDGSYVYFVAKGVLTEEEEGPTGQKAQEEANNLYLNHEGKTSFIARLSSEDRNDWASQPKKLSARVTPDGRHLVFLSIESQALADYENTIAIGQHCQQNINEKGLFGGPLCTQAFLYDAETDTLSCASCSPTGERPLGPAALPPWSNVYEGPRYLSDDGSRLFFDTYDALAEADVNGLRDVYEFERPGAGSCTTDSGTYDPVSGGCHFLVSSGTSSGESYLLDASSNGRDVFFSTRSQLVGWDTNENYDVYDYREGGGFPEPVEPQVCLGEACKAPPAAVAPTASPPEFVGPGNAKAKKPKPRHKKPAHHKKKDRKAKKKAHSHKREARR